MEQSTGVHVSGAPHVAPSPLVNAQAAPESGSVGVQASWPSSSPVPLAYLQGAAHVSRSPGVKASEQDESPMHCSGAAESELRSCVCRIGIGLDQAGVQVSGSPPLAASSSHLP